ncbi:MAG: iron chelate uptake ABC transporter family permease subunit [Pseudomonadota bacterium]
MTASARLAILALGLGLAAAIFMLWDLAPATGFILELRATKLATLLIVGVAVGTATIAFQTVSANRILTPSIMGFDALFLLIQTGLVVVLGGLGFALLPGLAKFTAESVIMMGCALLLFGVLLGRVGNDIERLVLTGIIFGTLFRAITAFLQRILDPSEFAMVQGVMFASFGGGDPFEIAIAGLVTLAAAVGLLWLAGDLDALALGRPAAIPLGVAVDRLRWIVLSLVSAMVAASTALVGPLAFLGLLVASLAHAAMPSYHHRHLLPAAALIAAIILVAGQTVFERLLQMQSTLAVLIEFAGGLLFLFLVLRGRAK